MCVTRSDEINSLSSAAMNKSVYVLSCSTKVYLYTWSGWIRLLSLSCQGRGALLIYSGVRFNPPVSL